MGFSVRDSVVRVDAFKPSGKWSNSIAVDMSEEYYTEGTHKAVLNTLSKAGYGGSDYTFVCLEPYHIHAHPVTVNMRSEPNSDFKTIVGKLIKVCDYPASDIFEDESIDWKYCVENAHFRHKEECEFILHLFLDDDSVWDEEKNRMKEFGCTDKFIKEVESVRRAGFEKVLLYAG